MGQAAVARMKVNEERKNECERLIRVMGGVVAVSEGAGLRNERAGVRRVKRNADVWGE